MLKDLNFAKATKKEKENARCNFVACTTLLSYEDVTLGRYGTEKLRDVPD